MVGSIGDRMLDITLPHVAAWNMWWSQYGNSVEGFVRQQQRVDDRLTAIGRDPAGVAATACVLVQLEGGVGRRMGEYDGGEPVRPFRGAPAEIAERLLAFEAAGAAHVQLVVDPITRDSLEWLADVVSAVRLGGRSH
jgi:alkanesulfonate monooxygenase SsuD/methylene tetrahydromethanopterin reductase-like flavin-dependent oxidoreductase (luciferase family)